MDKWILSFTHSLIQFFKAEMDGETDSLKTHTHTLTHVADLYIHTTSLYFQEPRLIWTVSVKYLAQFYVVCVDLGLLFFWLFLLCVFVFCCFYLLCSGLSCYSDFTLIEITWLNKGYFLLQVTACILLCLAWSSLWTCSPTGTSGPTDAAWRWDHIFELGLV